MLGLAEMGVLYKILVIIGELSSLEGHVRSLLEFNRLVSGIFFNSFVLFMALSFILLTGFYKVVVKRVERRGLMERIRILSP